MAMTVADLWRHSAHVKGTHRRQRGIGDVTDDGGDDGGDDDGTDNGDNGGDDGTDDGGGGDTYTTTDDGTDDTGSTDDGTDDVGSGYTDVGPTPAGGPSSSGLDILGQSGAVSGSTSPSASAGYAFLPDSLAGGAGVGVWLTAIAIVVGVVGIVVKKRREKKKNPRRRAR